MESLGKFRHNLPSSPYQGPHFVAVNNKNEIIVTDFHNHSVKVRRALRCTPGVQSADFFLVFSQGYEVYESAHNDEAKVCNSNSSRFTMRTANSCSNLVPMEKATASSMLRLVWLWTPMETSL